MSKNKWVIVGALATILFQFGLTLVLYGNHAKGHLGTASSFNVAIGLPLLLALLAFLFVQKATISKIKPLHVILFLGLAVVVEAVSLWVGMGIYGE